MIAPPSHVIDAARSAAMKSPCAKSKRGAVLFWVGDDPQGWATEPFALPSSSAFNGPPEPWRCDGSESCKKTCGLLCMHAETRCLHKAAICGVRKLEPNGFTSQMRGNANNYDLVHVKVVGSSVDPIVVPGGPPSCLQCSKAILDAGIRGVWLYLLLPNGEGQWRRYTATEFHYETISHLAGDDAAMIDALGSRRHR